MKMIRIALTVIVALGMVTGCAKQDDHFGDKKSDWVKTAPPPQFANATPPPSTPPMGTKKGQ